MPCRMLGYFQGKTMNEAAPAQRIDAAEGAGDAARMTFTGRGDEYFRIWIVNLFLTVLTLGIYSAWAKVRKTKYFWQNSRLDGAVFDFHGNPVAILKGRILALALLVAYSWSFEFSVTAGLVTIAILLAVGPWLFVKAQQFKFGNTSYRGLRFGFAATYRDGLRIVLPILVIWFSTTVVAAFVTADGGGPIGTLLLISSASLLLLPWMHHRLKWFQHARATYGDRSFAFEIATSAFYKTYVKAIGLVAAGAAAAFLASVIVAIPLALTGMPPPDWIGVALAGLAMYVFVWPYTAARLQKVVWDHTRLDEMRFHTQIAAWPLAKLVLRNIALTLVTAGLYWPFASVALARYRVECMRIDTDVPLPTIAVGLQARPAAAVGDAAADSFGLDLGL